MGLQTRGPISAAKRRAVGPLHHRSAKVQYYPLVTRNGEFFQAHKLGRSAHISGDHAGPVSQERKWTVHSNQRFRPTERPERGKERETPPASSLQTAMLPQSPAFHQSLAGSKG
jgi:hypothetical protein